MITAENARRGVTSLLATPATAPIANLVACLEFSRKWMAGEQEGSQVLGVHLEGPYFDLAQAGAQDPANVRNPDDGTAEQLLKHQDDYPHGFLCAGTAGCAGTNQPSG